MMNKIILILTFIFISLLQSCIEAPKNSRKSVSSASTTTTSTTSPTFASDELLYWYSSTKVQGTITINKTSQNTYYIRGSYIHNFLSSTDSSSVYNYNKQYCLVGNFSSSSYKQIRVRAIPVSTTSSSKVTERMMRIDLSADSDNSAQCNYSTIDSVTIANASFSMPNICVSTTNCSGLVTTSNLNFYTVNKSGSTITSLTKVDVASLVSSSINLQIDLSSNSTTETSSCSVSACSAKGFDCCIEGQCVKDASIKSSYTLTTLATIDPQAYNDYTANPLTFINYPNYFNICSNIAHASVNSTTTTTSSATTAAQSLATAQDRISAYLKRWYCMDDVATSVAAGTTPNYSRCYGTSTNGTSTAYDDVRYSLAKDCGCSVDKTLMDVKCPNWSVKPIYNSSVTTNSIANIFIGYYDATNGSSSLTTGASRGNYYIISKGGTINSASYLAGDWIIYDGSSWFKYQSNISDFYCYTPAVENQVGSITNLNVSVSARSAPHRFFANNGGVNYDDIAKLPSTITQEDKTGDTDFTYLDETNKSGPNNGAYNYKSILGTMFVDLSKTAPAKMVTVELGKTYILSSISGYFTPCPQCGRDSWFQSFFAHPTSQKGIGLQASGYSTTRDAYGNNDTLGNYEDTHFGRACYLPITMIPVSHQKNTDVQVQRLNRLKTQSAFFINGYQKDWFGFNQGALIGSFDGVSWFAVGTGRRVTATSTKLFLAFNAPFLDLATKTDTVVNIIPDMATNSAPNVDFDPTLSIKDPLQGTAATCQQYHQCNTDSECVAQLGWEYVCADVSQIKTTWPLFDSNANELKNQERVATLFDILSNTISTNTTKRCVYRGSGAPCKKDISYFNTQGNSTFKKMLTCAPNFYCSSINNNKFNNELVRTPNEFDNFLFGMDANVLGRPLNYVTATKPLASDIISNIQYNGTAALNLSTAAGDLGMCLPGKSLLTSISSSPETDYVRAHSNSDALKRTDYISQIGSCNSNATGEARTYNCPVIGTDGNYIDPSTDPSTLAAQQNSCNAEARQTSTYYSAFKTIEAGALSSITSLSSPTLAADACIRRAGSVCHTDLDCSPNSMHESLAGGINLNYFGGTDAERNYWSESLVCGQSTAQPLKNASNYYTYKLSDNKCCREIGKDFSMYTKGDKNFVPDQPTNSVNLDTRKFSYQDPSGTNRYSRYVISPLAHDPLASNIYGASDMVPQVPLSSGTIASTHEPNSEQWRVIHETGSLTCCGGGWIRKFADGTHTWPIKSKLSFDTSNFSCLNFRSPLADSNFPSLNASKMVSLPSGTPSSSKYIVTQTYQTEYDQFCKSPQDGGCLQIPFKDSSNFLVHTPEEYYPGKLVDQTEDDTITVGALDDLNSVNTLYSRIDTSPTEDPTTTPTWSQRVNVDVPYSPTAYYNPNNFGTYKGKAYNFFFNGTFGYSTHFYLPAYVGFGGKLNSGNTIYMADPGGANPQIANAESFIKKVYIKYYYDQSSGDKPPKVQDITQSVATDAECINALKYASPSGLPADALVASETAANKYLPKWCLSYSTETGSRPVMVVKADTNTNTSSTYYGWVYAGVVVDFIPIKEFQGAKVAIPGNPLYYLEKLSRLELLGIPQITYEPLYCNTNHDKLVPGIFKSTTAVPLTTRANINSSAYTYNNFDPIEAYNADDSVNDNEQTNYGNVEKKFVYQNQIDHAAVFSSKDFTCCTPLGKEPKNGAASCCSGYGVTKNNKTTCSLPTGTDLNVYFNKFVSSEGVGTEQPGGGLVATYITDSDGDGNDDYTSTQATDNIDFNPFTGEPKLRDSTYQKLYSLGVAYCSTGKVSVGAIFGSFPPEPFGGSYSSSSSSSSSSSTYSYPTSIVDSIIDINSDATAGKIMFDQGYRWNHHYYCK